MAAQFIFVLGCFLGLFRGSKQTPFQCLCTGVHMPSWFIECNPDVPVDKQLQTESSGLFVDLIVIWVVNSPSAPLTMDLQGLVYTAGAAPCSCWAQHCNTLLSCQTCCEHMAGNLLQWEGSSCSKMSTLQGQTGILHLLQFRASPRSNIWSVNIIIDIRISYFCVVHFHIVWEGCPTSTLEPTGTSFAGYSWTVQDARLIRWMKPVLGQI